MTKTYRTAELLTNGLVRVDCTSGLVRMYHAVTTGAGRTVQLRSGQGRVGREELERVATLLVADIPTR
jgi:hypothetical protein